MKNGNEKSAKIRKKYLCKFCDYVTSDKKDWNKHILTAKHKKSAKGTENKKNVEFVCKLCHKGYKYKSGLSRHKKKCVYIEENFCGKKGRVTIELPSEANLKKGTTVFEKSEKTEDDFSLKDILMQQLKQQNETIELLKQSIETNTKMMPKIGNNNNNTISINLFLNEQCKNAMNLTDFINQVHVSLEDLQYSKNNGFVEGVTNIFAKQLKDLKPTERPIHCSDKKRLQFYVKEDNKWSKDSNNEKIDETIYNIKMKQTSKLTDWEKLHPNYVQDPKLLNEWQQILNSMTEETGQRDKIKEKLKRNIAEHIQIKQALTDVNENK
tara:strand:+ start:1232 stop:2203 length:972 start_codon:yes stop_codon:yes gene_type:complete